MKRPASSFEEYNRRVERRTFLATLASAAALPAAERSPMKTRYFAIENYELNNGTQPARIHEYFSKHRIPALQKIHDGPMMVLEGLVAPHMPQVSFWTGFTSLDQMAGVMAKAAADAPLMKSYGEWEKGPEPPFQSQTVMLIEAAPYSPEVVLDKEKRKTRYYISARSLRVLWLEYEEGNPGGVPVKYTRKFLDYRAVQQTLVPYRTVLLEDGRQSQESRVLTITYGVKVSDSIFQRPEG